MTDRITALDEGRDRLFVRGTGGARLVGQVEVPGDKSISHRCLMLAAIAEGTSSISGLSAGEDVARTAAALRTMGIEIVDDGDGSVTVHGGALQEPTAVVDVGNSGTALRLLCGLWAPQQGLAVFAGDRSLARRPIDRVAVPLRMMGCSIDARGGRFAPVVIRGRDLHGISYTLPVASAQLKSAVLLAGLFASGTTTVIEPVPSRAHTEELLEQFGAAIERRDGSTSVERSTLRPGTVRVPGDPSQAAFWLAAGAATPGAAVTVSNLYLGPQRDTFLAVLERMGADLAVCRSAGTASVVGRELRATDISTDEVAGLIDEFPALAVAAALARGTSVVRGAEELRVKESDRIATIVAMLHAFGVEARELEDGYEIDGPARLRPGAVDAHGDHRIAMAATLLAASAEGSSTIDGWSCVATSYPTFAEHVDLLAIHDD